MDPAASPSPPLSRDPPPCGSKRRPLSSSSRASATNLTKYIKQFGYAPAPLPSSSVKVSAGTFLDADSEDRRTMEVVTSGSSSEGETSLVLPGAASLVDGVEVLTVSPMPSLRYDSDGSDADIDELLLPAPLVGDLEEGDELQLPAPLVGERKQATTVEFQSRGPRHVHSLDEL